MPIINPSDGRLVGVIRLQSKLCSDDAGIAAFTAQDSMYISALAESIASTFNPDSPAARLDAFIAKLHSSTEMKHATVAEDSMFPDEARQGVKSHPTSHIPLYLSISTSYTPLCLLYLSLYLFIYISQPHPHSFSLNLNLTHVSPCTNCTVLIIILSRMYVCLC